MQTSAPRDIPIVGTVSELRSRAEEIYYEVREQKHGVTTRTRSKPGDWHLPISVALSVASARDVAFEKAMRIVWYAFMEDDEPELLRLCHPPSWFNRINAGPIEKAALRLLKPREPQKRHESGVPSREAARAPLSLGSAELQRVAAGAAAAAAAAAGRTAAAAA